jgi:hypothetical protein
MSARPLIAGRLYRVRGMGLDLTIIAGHACDALIIAVEQLSCA